MSACRHCRPRLYSIIRYVSLPTLSPPPAYFKPVDIVACLLSAHPHLPPRPYSITRPPPPSSSHPFLLLSLSFLPPPPPPPPPLFLFPLSQPAPTVPPSRLF